MVEPLSILTGVASLLATSIKVGTELKKLINDVSIASVKVRSFLGDVESFATVLQLMQETFEQEKLRSSMQATGHVGNHWRSLSKSIEDGNATVSQLQTTLENVNKSVRLLDNTRRHFRLQNAVEEILVYQGQIRTCKDALQLSLQTVIVYESFKHLNLAYG
jgi:RNA binding exosome subunit